MPSRAETTITLTDAPEDGERTVVMDGLRAYNEERAGVSDARQLAILARGPDTREVVGALLARSLPRPPDGGTVLPAGEPAPRRARRPDTRYGGGRGAPARLHPCGVVDAALSGAGLLSEAGLGGRRPDRVRATRPHSVLHDEKSGLKGGRQAGSALGPDDTSGDRSDFAGAVDIEPNHQVVVTTFSSGSPRAKRSMFRATSRERRSMVPSVRGEQ